MNFLFGNKKPNEQILKQNARKLERSARGMDKEIRSLEQESEKLKMDIRKAAKQNEMASVKILAVQIARNKRYIKQYMSFKTELKVLSHKMISISCVSSMANVLKETTKVIRSINTKMRPVELQKTLAEFEKQLAALEFKGEMMSDAIDDAFEEDEVESDEVVNTVLAELGIEISEQLVNLPTATGSKSEVSGPSRKAVADGPKGPVGGADTIDDDDLEARLAQLKRG